MNPVAEPVTLDDFLLTERYDAGHWTLVDTGHTDDTGTGTDTAGGSGGPVPAPAAAVTAVRTIRLHKRAPWNTRLRRTYREWFTEVDGRYFKIRADYLQGPWYVWEIRRDGTDVDVVAAVRNLPQARLAIDMHLDGRTGKEILEATVAYGGAGTGRNHPRHVAHRHVAHRRGG